MMRKFPLFLFVVFLFSSTQAQAGKLSDIDPQVKASVTKELLNLVPKKDVKQAQSTKVNKLDDIMKIAYTLSRLGEDAKALKIIHDNTIRNNLVVLSRGGVSRQVRKIRHFQLIRNINQGKFDQAEKLIGELVDNRYKVDAYIIMADVQKKHGKPGAALKSLNHANKWAAYMTRQGVRRRARLVVARAYLRHDRKKEAQKVLFKISQLHSNDFRALLSLSKLFKKSGNDVEAKRIYGELKKGMEPYPKGQDDPSKVNDRQKQNRVLSAKQQRRELSSLLLSEGYINDWKKFYKTELKGRQLVGISAIRKIVRAGDVKLAIDIANKELSAEGRFGLFASEAMVVAPKSSKKALTLLNIAAPLLESRWEESHNGKSKLQQKNIAFQLVLMSNYYRQLGKKELGQKWFKKVIAKVPSDEVVSWKIAHLLMPITFNGELGLKSTFTDAQLLQIDKRLQTHISSLPNDGRENNLLQYPLFRKLPEFIYRQIKAGQKKQARVTLKLLDKEVKKQLTDSKEPRRYGQAFTIAQLWKHIGNKSRYTELLQEIVKHPDPEKKRYTKLGLIKSLFSHGFVDEGLHLYAELSPKEKRADNWSNLTIPNVIAKVHPHLFPSKIIKYLSPQEKVRFLSSFVDALVGSTYARANHRYSFDTYLTEMGGNYFL